MANQPKKYKKFVATAATATLVASAIVPVASAASLSDIAGNTHEGAINALVDAGVISGYPDGTFKPNKELTRSDVVKLLGKYLVSQGHSIPADATSNPRFADLSSKTNKELLEYAAVVADAGVFAGSNGKLLAGDAITRENMAIVLVRMVNTLNDVSLEEYVATQDFTREVKDINTAKAEARTAIDVLDFYDITSVANFLPKNTVTRGQFATFLNNVINADFSGAAATTGTVKAINNTTVEVTFADAIADVKDLTFKIEGLEVKNAVVKQTDSKTAVLTTAVQEAGKEYTVTVNGNAVGKFTGISAVIPTGISVVERSQQGVIGQQVTVKAQVTVADGQTKAGIPVTFNVTGTGSLNTPQLFEATTDANGVATYTYTRYANTTDDVVAYATGDRTKFSTGKVYWSNAAQLTVKDVTTDTTLVNGAKKVYQIDSAKNAGKYVFVTFAENLNVTPDKLTKNVVVEGVSTYTIKSDDSVGTDLGTSKYPYEVTTGGKAVTAVKLDSNGKANLVLTGSSASATPIVFEAPLKSITSSTPGSVVTDFSDVTYDATALQAKASTVKFELKHSLGLTIEAQGVQDAALRNSDGIGGRDYVVTYTDKDGKVANSGTKVLVGIPKAGLSNVSNVEVYDENETRLNSVTSDSKYVYYNVTVGKEGKATFTVTSSKENDYIAPVAFINNGTSAGISLDDSDLQTTGAITYFVTKVEFAAKLKLTDGSKAAKSFVAGKETAHFQYVLVDQNGKTRKADADTEVSFEVYAGTAPLTIVGQGTVPAGSYKTVKAKVSKGSSTAEIRVNAAAPTEATVTATGSKAGIVLTSTDPASVTATFTQFATNAITGVTVVGGLDKTANTLTLIDDKNNVYVYSYDGATLLQNNSTVYENTFETLVEAGARLTVSKDDAGKLTFNIIDTTVSSKTLSAQQNVDYLIKKAIVDNETTVTLPLNTSDSIVIDTTADLDIKVDIEKVAKLDIVAPNAEKIDLVAKNSGNINGALNVNAPKATVTVGTGVTVLGSTNIIDVDTNSFINEGTLVGDVTISDTNGARFVNNGTVSGTVEVTGNGSVTLDGTQAYAVKVSGAAQVVIPKNSAVSAVTVTNADADVTNNTGKDIVENNTEVKPVTDVKFEDKDKTTGTIKGELTFTASSSDNIESYLFETANDSKTVASKDLTKKEGKLVYTLTEAQNVAKEITVTAVAKDGKKSSAVKIEIKDDKTATEEAEKLSEATAEVAAEKAKVANSYEVAAGEYNASQLATAVKALVEKDVDLTKVTVTVADAVTAGETTTAVVTITSKAVGTVNDTKSVTVTIKEATPAGQ
ncbi:S-layer homology domain-containing protein [Solibacillus sp. FSL R5-0691]|uniref:S-layer homology domain-containing protein n=1 Tax=Solibacillus sp. FSL R5-0691 TaxID=2921653 RepID=UPI0030CA6130